MKDKLLLPVLLLTVATFANPQQPAATSADPQSTKSAGHSASMNSATEGEKKFVQNCGRCHTPPMSISPRIAKTILQHMRIRASLSKQDQDLILNYISPGLDR